MTSIELHNISHRYGSKFIFKNLTHDFDSKKLWIVKGTNGSGKSTLLKLIAQMIKPTIGHIQWKGEKRYDKVSRHEWVGFSHQGMALYPDLTGKEHIDLVKKLKGVDIASHLQRWIDTAPLSHQDWNRAIKTYSSGMKQRVKLICSVLHQPDLVLWDEPFSNLDDEGKQWGAEFIRQFSKTRLVLLASNESHDFNLSTHHFEIPHL